MKHTPEFRNGKRRAIEHLTAGLWLGLILPGLQAGVVAYWQFEQADPSADASGNNNVLSVVNVATVADKAANAPGAGSAVFDGTAYAQTAGTLNLSAYTAVTVEWWMKTEQADFGMILEHSANYNFNPGAFISYYNETPDRLVFANLAGGYAIRSVPLLRDGQWHHYAFTLEANDVSANRIQLYVDGELTAAATNSVASSAHVFLDDVFNIGARNGAGFFLKASLDEMRISDEILNPETFLLEVSYPDAAVTIAQEPADLEVLQNRSGSFSVQATIANAPASTLAYQWQSQPPGGGAWTDIVGATRSTYEVTAVTPAQHQQKYRVVVRGLASPARVTSREATLTVITDNIPPQVVSATALNPASIGLCFSEPLEAATATNPQSYTLAGVVVSQATLLADGRTVLLDVATLSGTTFNLTVAGVKDLAGNAMASTPVTGPILGLENRVIASEFEPPFEPGQAYSCDPATIKVEMGGRDIWGEADSFRFVYRAVTGDFDVRVQNASVTEGGFYGKAGLMVRESEDPASRELSVVTYPTRAIFAPLIRAETGGASDAFGPLVDFTAAGAAYPNVWVRFRRTGGTFAVYGGSNGEDWTPVAEITPEVPYPDTVLLGLCTTAAGDDVGILLKAEYRQYGNTLALPPKILEPPQSAEKLVGANHTFGVKAGGTDPFTYQWQKDGRDIAGANGPTLSLVNLQEADSGKYRVVVGNAFASVPSAEATLDVAPPALAATRRAIAAVAVFDAATRALNNRGDQAAVIDGDLGTDSYLTPSGTATANIVALDLGAGPVAVNRLRVAKSGDIDGIGAADNMDLELLYSTATGPLHERAFQPVRGLANGFLGAELATATAVNPNGTVDNERTDFATTGWFSLNFGTVHATALALRFARDAGDPVPYTHYRAFEIEAYYDTPTREAEVAFTGLRVFAVERAESTRDDAGLALDGNYDAPTYLTASGTVSPQIAMFDLGGRQRVSRIRVAPVGDVDGVGNVLDNLDLTISYTTESGEWLERRYQPVANLGNGYDGTELALAEAVNPDGTVDNLHHDYVTDGTYSLTFEAVEATAIAIRFQRDVNDDLLYTHFPVYEVEAYAGNTRVPLSGVRVFAADLNESTRNDAALAIDQDLGTVSYITASGTTGAQRAMFDLGSLKPVNRLRVAKLGDIDGLPGSDVMDLVIEYSVDFGELPERTYYPVAGLANGYQGAELIKATAVNPGGTIENDTHNYAADGWYSVTFDAVNATALAIRLARDPADPYPYIHYPAYEYQAFYSPVSAAPPPVLGIALAAGTITLSWPASAAGFELESAAGIVGLPWSKVEQPVVPENGLNTVAVAATGSTQFFRLRKP